MPKALLPAIITSKALSLIVASKVLLKCFLLDRSKKVSSIKHVTTFPSSIVKTKNKSAKTGSKEKLFTFVVCVTFLSLTGNDIDAQKTKKESKK